MIDYKNIEKYRENNRIEAKRAIGGLPHSIWETYSAFANTIGGIILLGVEEHKDKTLHPVNLPFPERLVSEFWRIINNPKLVSSNILNKENVQIMNINGNRIIAIEVPRAKRQYRPVYIGESVICGSYRRNGEGDYHCTNEEIQTMLRDKADYTQDTVIIEKMDMSVFERQSIEGYRKLARTHSGEDNFSDMSDAEFLRSIGAVGLGDDGTFHPTCGGLLMFGRSDKIKERFPDYLLEYSEQKNGLSECTYRILSSDGRWSGNIFDFYMKVCESFRKNILEMAAIVKLHAKSRPDFNAVISCLYEALANCLVNADYYGRCGLIVKMSRDEVVIENPGEFRMDIEEAISGGMSDPRNAALINMFSFIDASRHSGKGLSNIYSVWKKNNWILPRIIQKYEPERTILILSIKNSSQGIRSITERFRRLPVKPNEEKRLIIDYLTDNISASAGQLSKALHIRHLRINSYLNELMRQGLIVCDKNKKIRKYRLKS